MKKFILIFIISFFGISLFADSENLSDNLISIDFNINNNNVIISQITHVRSGQTFLKNPDKYLWKITAKKDNTAVSLFPKNAERLNIEKKEEEISFIWTNVKRF